MSADQSAGEAQRGDAGEKVGVFQSHPRLVPVTVIGSVVVAFVAMVVLTWVAGGGSIFR